MTKSEKYYQRILKQYEREYSRPGMQQIVIMGKVVTAQEAAAHKAAIDIKLYKQRKRNVIICCDGMQLNQLEAYDPENGIMQIGPIPNYKNPDGEPSVSMAGALISFCPFCGTRIRLSAFVDEEINESK